MGTRYCILTRITAAFTILLLLSGSFIQTTYAKKIEVNQIGEKQSIILMDGLEIRVPTPYIFVERTYVKRSLLDGTVRISLTAPFFEDKYGKVEKLINVTLELEVTEVNRKRFKLFVFEPIEYSLWLGGKPAKPLTEIDCDWRCSASLKLGDRDTRDNDIIVVGQNKSALTIVTKYVLRFLALRKTEEVTYTLPLPVRADGFGEVRWRFQSNVPVKIVVYCYNERTGVERATECHTAEGRGGSFSFKVDLYSKFSPPDIKFSVLNREREDAHVKLWAEFSWANVPNPSIARWYEGEEPGKTHERILNLLPRYVEKNWSYEAVRWVERYHYHGYIASEGYYPCSDKTGLDKLVVETEEPSGAKYMLLVLDRYDSAILTAYAPISKDPSGILPYLKPLAQTGSTSKARIELSNLTECPSVVAIRVDDVRIGIKYRLFTKWTEVPSGIFGEPGGWSSRTSLAFQTFPMLLLTPLRVEGEFKAERPVNFLIQSSYSYRGLTEKAIFFEALNAKTGKFSFYTYGLDGIDIIAVNLGWEPNEVKVWIKYEPVQSVPGVRSGTETRTTTSPLRTTTILAGPKTTTATTGITQAVTFTATTAVSDNNTAMLIALPLIGIVAGILVGFIIANRKRSTGKSDVTPQPP
jgi:hypothetical protein